MQNFGGKISWIGLLGKKRISSESKIKINLGQISFESKPVAER
jgi:hypothetical protein